MNCLLMRELPQEIVIRLWDTYLAQGSDFSVLHVYVCAALLITFRDDLMSREFMELVMFLQSLPTGSWGESEISVVLSQAYVWMTLFEACPKHLSDE
jgi:TBC1 domain family member 2